MADDANMTGGTVERSVNDLSRYPRIPNHLLVGSQVLADRWAALPLWPKDAVIAEVGVALGDFSQAILNNCRPRKFIAIDRFDLHEIPMLWGKSTREHFSGQTHEYFYRNRFAHEIAEGAMEIIKGDSAPSISALPDESVDLFYVDADHLYDGVRKDLDALLPKVKPDGWIIMNDYLAADTFANQALGVIQATNEFMVKHEWKMVYFALAPIMYCDVGLRRVDAPDLDWEKPAMAAAQRAQARAAALEATIGEIRASTSWRVTAPLRGLSRLFRRGGR